MLKVTSDLDLVRALKAKSSLIQIVSKEIGVHTKPTLFNKSRTQLIASRLSTAFKLTVMRVGVHYKWEAGIAAFYFSNGNFIHNSYKSTPDDAISRSPLVLNNWIPELSLYIEGLNFVCSYPKATGKWHEVVFPRALENLTCFARVAEKTLL